MGLKELKRATKLSKAGCSLLLNERPFRCFQAWPSTLIQPAVKRIRPFNKGTQKRLAPVLERSPLSKEGVVFTSLLLMGKPQDLG